MSDSDHIPTVSVGLPVYNGARYISQAIDSVLAQDFEEFELIISDNASTDETFKICQEYAAKDSRIRVYQNETNLGAIPNFTRVFELARGKFFKWIAYDDWIEPPLLGESVRILESRPDVALCYPMSKVFSEDGQQIDQPTNEIDLTDDDPSKRYLTILNVVNNSVFGLMRVEEMRRTKLMKPIAGGDRPFLAEMALIGKTYLIPEPWYCLRVTTSARSLRAGQKNYITWWSTSNRGRYMPRRPVFIKEYLSIVHRSALPARKKPILYLKTIWHLSKIRRRTIVHFLKRDRTRPFRELKYLVWSLFGRGRAG